MLRTQSTCDASPMRGGEVAPCVFCVRDPKHEPQQSVSIWRTTADGWSKSSSYLVLPEGDIPRPSRRRALRGISVTIDMGRTNMTASSACDVCSPPQTQLVIPRRSRPSPGLGSLASGSSHKLGSQEADLNDDSVHKKPGITALPSSGKEQCGSTEIRCPSRYYIHCNSSSRFTCLKIDLDPQSCMRPLSRTRTPHSSWPLPGADSGSIHEPGETRVASVLTLVLEIYVMTYGHRIRKTSVSQQSKR